MMAFIFKISQITLDLSLNNMIKCKRFNEGGKPRSKPVKRP